MVVGRVLIVGHPELPHLGALFAEAAIDLLLEARIEAVGPGRPRLRLTRSLVHRTIGTRPVRVASADGSLITAVESFRPDVVLTTGFPDFSAGALQQVRNMGIRTAVYLSDDPWNVAQTATWALPAIEAHDLVLTPRTANIEQLRASTRGQVHIVPFGYSPAVHQSTVVTAERGPYVLFYGGADAERTKMVRSLLRADVEVRLYGGRWGRAPGLRRHSLGTASLETLREEVPYAAVCLVLVRRANRDGHTMRTYEAAAMGGTLLVERTADHEALFGPDGHCVRYFGSDAEMVERAREMLAQPNEAVRLAVAAQKHITASRNTYSDRLATILDLLE